MFSTVTPQKRKRKIHFGSCHSWTTDWPIPTIIWSTLCSRHIIQLDSPAISFVRSIQRSYSIALDSLDNAMCRLPNLTPLRVTPFALFRNLIQNFIPPVQDSIQLFGNSLPIHPAASIQMTSDIKNGQTTMVWQPCCKSLCWYTLMARRFSMVLNPWLCQHIHHLYHQPITKLLMVSESNLEW